MEGLFRLSEQQLERIKPFFPNSGGVSRVDEPKVLSGIIQVQRQGLRSRGGPAAYGARVPDKGTTKSPRSHT